MDYRAVPDAWPSAAGALHIAVNQFEVAELTSEEFRDQAVRILEELSASSPHAAELLEPGLDAVRQAPAAQLARMARPLAAEIERIALETTAINEFGAQQMGP